jgi:thiol-disulfide isomerase/thioredoxin
VFVDEALVARPEDFYAWGGPPTGRYLPWKEIPNRRRFQSDLRRMLDIRLAGGEVASLPASKSAKAPRVLPSTPLVDLDGRAFRLSELRGKPVIVELWATWCPPCLATLEHLRALDPKAATVVAVALESDRKDVDRVVAKLRPQARIAMGTRELRDALDGPPAIPTLLVADREGRIVRVFYGAAPGLYDEVARELAHL